ncbi:DLW-39 family protein [Rhodococcus sp. 1163]|nr:DLW-39 family protein [Rhodococcus sp. 1163]
MRFVKILVLAGAVVTVILTVMKLRAVRSGDGVWHEVTTA